MYLEKFKELVEILENDNRFEINEVVFPNPATDSEIEYAKNKAGGGYYPRIWSLFIEK